MGGGEVRGANGDECEDSDSGGGDRGRRDGETERGVGCWSWVPLSDGEEGNACFTPGPATDMDMDMDICIGTGPVA